MEDKFPLHTAVRNGELAKAEDLLKSNKSLLNSVNDNGKTPLHEAVDAGHIDIVLMLLSDGDCDVNYADGTYKNTALHIAAAKDDSTLVETLLAYRARDDLKNAIGNMPIHIAAEKGKLANVELLANNKSIINATNETTGIGNTGQIGKTPLQLACVNGRNPVVAYLSKVSNVNQFDLVHFIEEVEVIGQKKPKKIDHKICKTALYFAVEKENEENINALHQYQADPNAVAEQSGQALIHTATFENKPHVITILCALGADANKQNRYLKTPLFLAIERGCIASITALIEGGANTELPDGDQWPIHFAAERRNAEAVLALCQGGANPNAKNDADDTAIHIALSEEDLDVLEVLCPRIDMESMNDIEPLIAKVLEFDEDDDDQELKVLAALTLLTENDCPVTEKNIKSARKKFPDNQEIHTLLQTAFDNQKSGAKKKATDTSVKAPLTLHRKIPKSDLLSLPQNTPISRMSYRTEGEEEEQVDDKQHVAAEAVVEIAVEEERDTALVIRSSPRELSSSMNDLNESIRKALEDQAKEIAKKLETVYLQSHKKVSPQDQVFFKLISKEAFSVETTKTPEGDNPLHLMAKSPHLACVVEAFQREIGDETFQELISAVNNKGYSPAHLCVLARNVQLTDYLAKHHGSAMKAAGRLLTTDHGYTIAHCLGLSHGSDQANMLKLLFQGSKGPDFPQLDRHLLWDVNISEDIYKIISILTKLFGELEFGKLAAQIDKYGNHLGMLGCYSGNEKFIKACIDILLIGGVPIENIFFPLLITKVTPLEVACSFGKLGSVQYLLNLLTNKRYAACLTQNEFFAFRNIIDWCVLCRSQLPEEKETILSIVLFLVEKLEDELTKALTRNSPTGSLLCRVSGSIPSHEALFNTTAINLSLLPNKLELAVDIFSTREVKSYGTHATLALGSPVVSPRSNRKPDTLTEVEEFQLRLMQDLSGNYCPRKLLPWLRTSVNLLFDRSNVRGNFITVFKQIFTGGTESKNLYHAMLYLTALYRCEKEPKQSEEEFVEFCKEHSQTLTQLVSAFYNYLELEKKSAGDTLLITTFNTQSLIKLMVSTLIKIANVAGPIEQRPCCSPGYKPTPLERIYLNNFKKMIAMYPANNNGAVKIPGREAENLIANL